jgi:hypothetical protein
MFVFIKLMLAGYMPISFVQLHKDVSFQNHYVQSQQEAMSKACGCLESIRGTSNNKSAYYTESNSTKFWQDWSDPQKRQQTRVIRISGKNTLPVLSDSFPNSKKLFLMNVHHEKGEHENPLNLQQFKQLTHLEINHSIQLNPMEWKLLSKNPIRSIKINMSSAKDIPFHLFPLLREIHLVHVWQLDYTSFSKNTQLESMRLYKVSGINTMDHLDVKAFPCLKTLRILDLHKQQKNIPKNIPLSIIENLDVYHFNLSKTESGMQWSVLRKTKKATETRSLLTTKTLVDIN